jgi:hypothetical protein
MWFDVIAGLFATDLLLAFSTERIIYIQDNCGSRILSHVRLFQYTEYHLSLATFLLASLSVLL